MKSILSHTALLLALSSTPALAQRRAAAAPAQTAATLSPSRAPSAPEPITALPEMQASGLPRSGVIRRTDARPTCRSGCAARWYVCGPQAADCTAAQAVCLASCEGAATKFGEFAAAPG